MKTTNICKTEPNETKACFTSGCLLCQPARKCHSSQNPNRASKNAF